ncbi:hypothetical protein HQ560_08800, partial [bacterium]|nr:hypothetical protein [bacterium]
RTDDLAWPDSPFGRRGSPEDGAHRSWVKAQRDQALQWARERREREAKAVLEESATREK